MKFLLTRTIRRRLALVVVLSALPAVALGAISYLNTRREAGASAQTQALSFAHLAVNEQERLIQETNLLLRALAHEVRGYGPGVCRSYFAELQNAFTWYANIGVIALDGRVICSGLPMTGTVNAADRRYFREALRSRDVAVGDYQIGRITKKATFNIGFPILDDRGQPQGVVFAAVEPTFLHHFATRLKLPDGSTLTLLDRKGTIMARFPNSEQWIGKRSDARHVQTILKQGEGVMEQTGLDGRVRFYGFTPIRSPTDEEVGYIAVGLPLRPALALANRLGLQTLAALLVMAFILLAASWTGGEVLVRRPVEAVIRAARRIREGDLSARTGLDPAPDDLGGLALTFDQMAGALEAKTASLHETEAELRQTLVHLREGVEDMQALRAIDLAILNSLDIRVSLAVIVDQALDRLAVDAADVHVLVPDSQDLRHVAGRGFRTPADQAFQTEMTARYGAVALRTSEPVILPDLDQTAGGLPPVPFRGYGAVPLTGKGEVRGILQVFGREGIGARPEWREFLDTLAGQAAIAIDNARLFQQLQRANTDLAQAYDATLEGWSRALDLRDRETEGHTLRVTELTVRLAKAVGIRDEELIHVRRGALLHDIGKMGVPDAILLKPGPLTDDEWKVMSQHPTYAHGLLSSIPFLRPALSIPWSHHERWDGSGYPLGLKREEIPLPARVFAVIDVWDALTSDRPYRKAWSKPRARAHIKDQAGSQFDPQVVRVFLQFIDADDAQRTPEPSIVAPTP